MSANPASRVQPAAPTGRYPSHAEIQELHDQRDRFVQALSKQKVITASDLVGLCRYGCCAVANDHWALCDEVARQALLGHGHHFVRACATIAQQEFSAGKVAQ